METQEAIMTETIEQAAVQTVEPYNVTDPKIRPRRYPNRGLDKETKLKILEMYDTRLDLSCRQIAKICNVSYTTVGNLVKQRNQLAKEKSGMDPAILHIPPKPEKPKVKKPRPIDKDISALFEEFEENKTETPDTIPEKDAENNAETEITTK